LERKRGVNPVRNRDEKSFNASINTVGIVLWAVICVTIWIFGRVGWWGFKNPPQMNTLNGELEGEPKCKWARVLGYTALGLALVIFFGIAVIRKVQQWSQVLAWSLLVLLGVSTAGYQMFHHYRSGPVLLFHSLNALILYVGLRIWDLLLAMPSMSTRIRKLTTCCCSKTHRNQFCQYHGLRLFGLAISVIV
jgi:fatty acid desaturase